MNPSSQSSHNIEKTEISRRSFIATSSAGIVATVMSSSGTLGAEETSSEKPIRWGFVGTGSIATLMAKALQLTPSGTLAASSSRTLEKAETFASKHGASKAFNSWQEMVKWDGIDAVYVATPTSVREEICIAAAKAGKHVLGEKPLASLPSLERIIAACKENKVAFMDGTHFSHHPRTTSLQGELDSLIGTPRNVNSMFHLRIRDKSNIRMQPKLEPMGALGDAGWYNMRAIVDYMNYDKLNGVNAYLRRDPETDAVVGCSGVVAFKDGATSIWSCSFDAGFVRSELSIDGQNGNIEIAQFVGHDRDNSGSYRYRRRKDKIDKVIRIEAPKPDSALLFEDFSAQIYDPSLRERWFKKSAQTQELLDAAWASAIENEKT